MWENFVSTRLRCASFFSPALLGLPSHQQRCLSVRVPGKKKTLTARVRAYLCTLSHFVLRALILSDLVWASHLILHLLQTAHSRTETCFPSGAYLLQGGKSIFFASDLQMRVWSSGGYNTEPAVLRMQCQSYQVNSFVTMICGGNRFLIGNELLGKAAPHLINACSRSRAYTLSTSQQVCACQGDPRGNDPTSLLPVINAQSCTSISITPLSNNTSVHWIKIM